MQQLLPTPQQCFGCHACQAVCPQRAIAMLADEDGFVYPRLDSSCCEGCSLCLQVCPALQTQNYAVRPLKFVGCRHLDDSIRMPSSSGGLFPALASNVLAKGGVVYGAAFDNDDQTIMVKHKSITDESHIAMLQGSKYVQSDMSGILESLLTQLPSVPVLFSGTPCQVAAARAIAGEYAANLLTMDVICDGVVSPLLFKAYIKSLGNITEFCFRDKSGGHGSRVVSWKKDGKKFFSPHILNSYITYFIQKLALRPACHTCPFASLARPGDISGGDFHGAKQLGGGLDDDKGVSIALLNSSKGVAAWQSIQHLFFSMPVTEEQTMQPRLYQAPQPSSRRRQFMHDLRTMSYPALELRYYNHKSRQQALLRVMRAQRNMETS